MKKSIFILAISTFMVGMLGTSCKSDTAKEAEAEDVVEATHEAKQDEAIVEQDKALDEMSEQKVTDDVNAEWNAYKAETEAKIKANEKLISDLKLEIKKADKKYDEVYLKNIELIEKRNSELNSKINNLKVSSKEDWKEFKTEFNRDLDELGKSIGDLTRKDNKK
ncbi:hypothetical protein FLJC2902T_28470 [Flavobacterium limnosediminis JC2902]|uniref:Lipoprotein n=1 Tax=Flavobacterium limnosediminis JC2902 TaxID=1341181 RepID=V6SJC6_9FLAO|nr:hypothetical protein [Flavobacterium limnosediminis]ESU26362.1 hypothetical protein FLJC2902T_28470 [Flavobacterium limnosediminis JC2902]